MGQVPPLTSNIAFPGTGQHIRIPTFVVSGRIHKGHRVYLPDGWSAGSNFKLVVVVPGQGATPTSMANNVLDTFIAAIGAAQITQCVIVFLRISDPRDMLDSWGLNCADGFDHETMVNDVISWAASYAKASSYVGQRVMVGFSEGGHITCRYRAKYGASRFAAYAVLGAPRLDADLGGAANSYTAFSTPEKQKLFNNSAAACQAAAPFASIAGTGLFNTLGANAGGLGSAPLLMVESDPGDAVTAASMSNAVDTRLPAVPVTFTSVNVDNAGFTPGHNPSDYFDAWFAEATNNLSWLWSQMSSPPAGNLSAWHGARGVSLLQ